MATQPTSGLTYDDLQRFPDDGLRREIIDGELFVTAAPAPRHGRVSRNLTVELSLYAREHGGEMLPPVDVYFSHTTVVEPDILYFRGAYPERPGERFIRVTPDLVVEISSPSTRRVDLGRKRDLYERMGVPEYWFVDLQKDEVRVFRLADGGYGEPEVLHAGDTLESSGAPGFRIEVAELLPEL